ncbi:putative bifunctional diguanylate cyclase/phosphodiesterase [Vibrio navarrensis]|uniref:putative bifunctional diguanylate cyclase/phosphodiesterase n=1 Tax=Vibrio navarrensis TaxID=29495 RepID=UPI00338D8BFD
MKSSTLEACIELDTLIQALSLDGNELLHQVTLELQRKFAAYSTCILQVDLHSGHTSIKSCTKRDSDSDLAHATPESLERVALAITEYCLSHASCYCSAPHSATLTAMGIKTFVGIPLHAPNGDILGMLISVYDSPPQETVNLIKHHQVYAKLAAQSLREQWLTARSDQLVNQLSYEVSHDNLTGLENRSSLSDTLETLTEQTESPFSLVYLDIDNFKLINDIHGNYIGDQILKFTANAIRQVLPPPRLAYRISGDEFALITFAAQPEDICQQILDSLSPGYQDKCNHVGFDVSMGIAKAANKRVVSGDELILNATLAMKECKKYPQERIRCYDTHLSANYHRKSQLIEAIREQLSLPVEKSQEFYVVIQPIVNVNNKRWDYFEVLARWNSAEYGPVSPVEFIDAAEQSGLITQLSERIIELACQSKVWLENELGYRVKLGVNCSAYELVNDQRYLAFLDAMMRKYHHHPKDFVVELTETVLLTHSGKERLLLDALRQKGFQIALDDFGTGYSSLNYIYNYPIDVIKIDASFVRNMLSNQTAERVIWLVIQLASQLNVDLVAEGVEDERELNKLVEMGCERIQGYYYSKPQKPQEIIARLQAQSARSA